MSIELVMPSNSLILCHPLLLLPSIFPSIRIFSNESVLLIRWPKYWSFRISPFNEYSGLISFNIDWLDLLEVQGTLKSLLHHHSSKASILGHSVFFIVQLSIPLEKEMATHSSTLAWKIPWIEKPGGLQSIGSQRQTRLSDFPFLSFPFSIPYMTTGKAIALTRRTFVGKVLSLLLNMLSRVVITSLPRSKLQEFE